MNHSNPLLDSLLKILDESQASEVAVIDVRQQTTITDYMIICNGRSSRHVKAIADQLMQHMKARGLPPLHHTGLDAGEWALVDFGDFIVHIMQPATRAFYNLEDLWNNDPA